MALCSSDRILCERDRGFAGGLLHSCVTGCQCSLGWSTAGSHTDKALGVSERRGKQRQIRKNYIGLFITQLSRVNDLGT